MTTIKFGYPTHILCKFMLIYGHLAKYNNVWLSGGQDKDLVWG